MPSSLKKKKDINKKSSSGFTLIELVIVVALVAITFAVTSDVLISLMRSQSKTQTMINLEQQASAVSLKLEKDARNAIDVTYNSSTGILTVLRKNAPVPIEYRITTVSGIMVLERRSDNKAWVPLTDRKSPGGVAVSCLLPGPACFSVTGSDPKVFNMGIRLYAVASNSLIVNTGNIDINNTFVIRGTY